MAIFHKRGLLEGEINKTFKCSKISLKWVYVNVSICRLKLEALGDKDPGILDADSENEDSCAAQSLDPGTTQANSTTESNLPNSQDPSGELSASQPQPASTEALLDEEDLLIEEYDSD